MRPEFEAVDGFAEETLWVLEGLIVALGFIHEDQQHIIGSDIMFAPGLCLTATYFAKNQK
ncbi:hypothetical protein [Vibrio splendidus]|uniref:hypothetical protein n=1 Tax=Vibrio splendidus TaxID=29497 RepID=UPI0011B293ED|nr:hypothetical protein [Vibrio splendidus]